MMQVCFAYCSAHLKALAKAAKPDVVVSTFRAYCRMDKSSWPDITGDAPLLHLEDNLADPALAKAARAYGSQHGMNLDVALLGRPKSCAPPFDGHFAMPGLADFQAEHLLAMIADDPRRRPDRYKGKSRGDAGGYQSSTPQVLEGLVPGQK